MANRDSSFISSHADLTYGQFIASMDADIAWLQEQARAHNFAPLNFDINTLDDLEELFALVTRGLDRQETIPLGLIFAKYLGETVRKTYGGEWKLCEDQGPSYHIPVISWCGSAGRQTFSPFIAIMGQSMLKTRGMLKVLISVNVDRNWN